MNETQKTATYAGVAGALLLLALVTRTWGPATAASVADEGQPFFPEFKEFSQATSLEVVEFDTTADEPVPFKVELRDGVWRIPSKNDYPADGKERLGKLAAAVLDLKRDSLRSDREADQAAMGVIDPAAETGGDEGRGRRVTLRDAGGKKLADLIVGKSVENAPDLRYVRLPDEKRIYAVRAGGLDASTKFEDWIERDLMLLDVASVTTLTVNKYSVDEQLLRRQGVIRIEEGERFTLGKKDGSWTLADGKPEEKLVQYKVSDVTDALDKLQIVDAAPFDEGRLSAAGFFPVQAERGKILVYSNEGEVEVGCEDGVRYTVRFGEALPGADKDEGLRRWVVIDAAVDEAALPKGADGKVDEAAKKQAAERATELNERFARWFYVISAKSYEALRPKRADLLEATGHDDEGDEHGPGDGHDHGGESEGAFPPVPDGQAPGVSEPPQGPPPATEAPPGGQ